MGDVEADDERRPQDAYARFTGTAPIPVWSGGTSGKVRLNRGGNRTMNCALHMIAVTRTRGVGSGGAYVDKLTSDLAPIPRKRCGIDLCGIAS